MNIIRKISDHALLKMHVFVYLFIYSDFFFSFLKILNFLVFLINLEIKKQLICCKEWYKAGFLLLMFFN